MIDGDQRWYYLERAKQSLDLAIKAIDPAVAAIHLDLYERYLGRAAQRVRTRSRPV